MDSAKSSSPNSPAGRPSLILSSSNTNNDADTVAFPRPPNPDPWTLAQRIKKGLDRGGKPVRDPIQG